MHGLIHEALDALAAAKGAELPSGSSRHEQYSDDATLERLAMACERLETSAEPLLRELGESFVPFVISRGYGPILDSLGRTFTEFLGRLDAMHASLEVSFPGARLPTFSLARREPERCIVLYRSERGALLVPLVEGLLEASARHLGVIARASAGAEREGAIPITVVLVRDPDQRWGF